MKKLFPLLCAQLPLSACGPALPGGTDRSQVAAPISPAYGFARSAASGRADVRPLPPPARTAIPASPLRRISSGSSACGLFIYLGGESDTWVEAILSAIEPQGEALRENM